MGFVANDDVVVVKEDSEADVIIKVAMVVAAEPGLVKLGIPRKSPDGRWYQGLWRK